MSKRTLAACLLALLAAPLPVAGATAGMGPCVSEGPPPTVATGTCGPKIVVHIYIPAAGIERQMDIGPCQVDCSETITIEVIVCADWSEMAETPTLDDPQPVVDYDAPTIEKLMEDAEDKAKDMAEAAMRDVESWFERTVEMETFLSCDEDL